MFVLVITVSLCPLPLSFFFFFFNDTATTEIYTLSLHDALPISLEIAFLTVIGQAEQVMPGTDSVTVWVAARSEEHTSELQSRLHLVCRLLLEKKKKSKITDNATSQQSYATSCRMETIERHDRSL